MNKREIIAYFDARAPEWDARMVRSDSKIAFILDAAGVRPGVSVLDVACGTGVLFGDYLARDAARVTGVDISPEMARIAVSKLRDPRVEVLCGDVEELALPRRYDCCVVYNAFPHFAHPARLLARLSACLSPGGRLTVAHGRGPRREPAHAGAGTPGRADAAVPCGGRRGLGYGKIRRLGAAAVSGVHKVFSKAPAPEPAPFSFPARMHLAPRFSIQ